MIHAVRQCTMVLGNDKFKQLLRHLRVSVLRFKVINHESALPGVYDGSSDTVIRQQVVLKIAARFTRIMKKGRQPR